MATMIDAIRQQWSDNQYMVRSKLLVAPDDGYYGLIQVPHYAFVTEVTLWVKKAYVAGAPIVSVGWAGNGETAVEDGFIHEDYTRVSELGFKSSLLGSATSTRSKYFNTSGGIITLSVAAGGATTEGDMMLFANYFIIM